MNRKQQEAAILDLLDMIDGFTVETDDEGQYIVMTGMYRDFDGLSYDDKQKAKILEKHFDTEYDDDGELIILTGIYDG